MATISPARSARRPATPVDKAIYTKHALAAIGCTAGWNHDRKIDRLKYAYHDTNDHSKFPQFAPAQYLHHVKYPDNGATLLELKQWAAGLDIAGLLKILDVPHFGCST